MHPNMLRAVQVQQGLIPGGFAGRLPGAEAEDALVDWLPWCFGGKANYTSRVARRQCGGLGRISELSRCP
jgi:hypothetical protein